LPSRPDLADARISIGPTKRLPSLSCRQPVLFPAIAACAFSLNARKHAITGDRSFDSLPITCHGNGHLGRGYTAACEGIKLLPPGRKHANAQPPGQTAHAVLARFDVVVCNAYFVGICAGFDSFRFFQRLAGRLFPRSIPMKSKTAPHLGTAPVVPVPKERVPATTSAGVGRAGREYGAEGFRGLWVGLACRPRRFFRRFVGRCRSASTQSLRIWMPSFKATPSALRSLKGVFRVFSSLPAQNHCSWAFG